MPKFGQSQLAPALAWPKYFYQGFNRQYFRKVLSYRPIAFWPLWEASGSVAEDLGPNGLHGAYTGVTLGQIGIGDGRSCPLFDGVNDFVNIYSTGLNSAFDGSEMTALIWLKVFNSGVWTDGSNHRIFQFHVDDNNITRVNKHSNNNVIEVEYLAGGTYKNIWWSSVSETDWVCLAWTVSKTADQLKMYQGGSQQGSTATGLGTWAGNLLTTGTLIGAVDTGANDPFYGSLALAAVFNGALNATKIADLAVV